MKEYNPMLPSKHYIIRLIHLPAENLLESEDHGYGPMTVSSSDRFLGGANRSSRRGFRNLSVATFPTVPPIAFRRQQQYLATMMTSNAEVTNHLVPRSVSDPGPKTRRGGASGTQSQVKPYSPKAMAIASNKHHGKQGKHFKLPPDYIWCTERDRNRYRKMLQITNSFVKIETDKQVVECWRKLSPACLLYMVHVLMVWIVVGMFVVGYPQGFANDLLTLVTLGPGFTVLNILSGCSFISSAAGLALTIVTQQFAPRFGKRWILIYVMSFLAVLCNIYGACFVLGGSVFIADQLDSLMIKEMQLNGFNSTKWQTSQSMFMCCGLTSYASWDMYRDEGVPIKFYPQSCCNPSKSLCHDHPTAEEVHTDNVCLDKEVLVFRASCYVIFCLLGSLIYISGFVCFYSFKLHCRYRWLLENKYAKFFLNKSAKENPPARNDLKDLRKQAQEPSLQSCPW